MDSIFDLYLRNDIMNRCESFFDEYLIEQGVPEEKLTEEDRKLVEQQVDAILDMITRIHLENEGSELTQASEVIDKLIGFCVVAKMNEARLCRLLNEKGI